MFQSIAFYCSDAHIDVVPERLHKKRISQLEKESRVWNKYAPPLGIIAMSKSVSASQCNKKHIHRPYLRKEG